MNLLIQRASKLLPLLQGDFRQLSTPSCFAKIAVRPSTLNLKNPLQITSSRVKQLVQKLASTLANRYENWCVTNFAQAPTLHKLDQLRAIIRKVLTLSNVSRNKYIVKPYDINATKLSSIIVGFSTFFRVAYI